MSYGTKYTVLPQMEVEGYEPFDPPGGLWLGGSVVLGKSMQRKRKTRGGCPQSFRDKQMVHIEALLSEMNEEPFEMPKFHKPKRRYVACRNEFKKEVVDGFSEVERGVDQAQERPVLEAEAAGRLEAGGAEE